MTNFNLKVCYMSSSSLINSCSSPLFSISHGVLNASHITHARNNLGARITWRRGRSVYSSSKHIFLHYIMHALVGVIGTDMATALRTACKMSIHLYECSSRLIASNIRIRWGPKFGWLCSPIGNPKPVMSGSIKLSPTSFIYLSAYSV